MAVSWPLPERMGRSGSGIQYKAALFECSPATPTGFALAFHPDGSRLASAGADRTVRLWDVNGGREVLTLRGHHDRVLGVAFSPDGTCLASASADGDVRIWETEAPTAEPKP